MKVTQADMVLAHLKRASITHREADREYDCTRLADVVFRLKKRGHQIRTEIVHSKNGKHWARYHLQGAA